MKGISFLIIILLSTITYAIEFTSLYSGEVKNGEEIIIDERSFLVVILDTNNDFLAKVKFPNGRSSILIVDECVFEKPYNFCITDLRQGDDDEFDIKTQSYPLYADIKVEKLEADISLVRTFEKTTFLEGETVNVDVSIVNDGSAHIFDAKYIDEFPAEIELKKAEGCTRLGNKIIWDVNLFFGKEVSCSYIIRGRDAIEFESLAYVEYDSENITDRENLVVENSPLKIETSISSNYADVGDSVTIKIDIINEDDEISIPDLDYKIYLPRGLEIIDNKGGLSKFLDYYIYSSKIEESENKSLLMTSRVEKTGVLTILEEISYSVTVEEDKKDYKYSNTYEINSTVKDLEINVQKDKYEIGGKILLPVVLMNPNKIALKNIDVTATTDFGDAKQTLLGILQPDKSHTIFALEGNALKESHVVNISSKYKTAFGESFRKKEDFIVGVASVKKKGSTPAEIEPEEVVEEEKKANTSSLGVGGLKVSNVDPETSKEEFTNYSNLEKGIREIQKPVWIVIATAVITLIFLIVILIKKNREDNLEERLNELK